MLEKDINELLQDYKYRKNILEEITLTDIDKWNNIDIDVSWSDVLNKPTDLEGYGLKTEIKENTLNKFSAVNGDFLVNLGFNIKYGDYSIFGIQTDVTTGAPTPKFGMVYDNEMYSYVSTALGNLNLIASDSVYLDTPHFNLKTPWFYVSTSFGTFDVNLKNANAEIFANVPFRTEKPIKAPRLDVLNSSSTREGMLYNSTYKVNDVVHDGIHLRHEDGKYLVLGHLDSTAGENGTVYSYMICDVDGVLRDPSDGDEWGPIRFEQQCFFRYGLRISNNEPLIINNYNLATKIASIESAIEEGTGMVKWTNVLNKPSTFTPSSHTHAIANITSLQSSLDGKASSSHNHNINDITDLVSVLNNKIGADGGTLSGNLVLNNNVSLQSKKNDGTIVNLLNMSSNNQVTVGNGLYKVGLVGKTADDIFVWDNTENVSYKVFNEKNLNYDETIAIVNCNTVNASSSEVYISSINQKILDRYSILSTENNKFTITIKETGFYKIDTSVLFGSLNTSLKMYINNDVHTLGYGNRNADIQRLSSGEISLIQGDKITFSFVGGSGVCAIWPVSVIRVH